MVLGTYRQVRFTFSFNNINSVNRKLHKLIVMYFSEFRETVSERLKDQEDGTFIVRDSRRFPGEYTLTLRYILYITLINNF